MFNNLVVTVIAEVLCEYKCLEELMNISAVRINLIHELLEETCQHIRDSAVQSWHF